MVTLFSPITVHRFIEESFTRLVFGFCSVRLPAPLESRTNETVAFDTSRAGVQPLILELRYAPDSTPLIETAKVTLLSSSNAASSPESGLISTHERGERSEPALFGVGRKEMA